MSRNVESGNGFIEQLSSGGEKLINTLGEHEAVTDTLNIGGVMMTLKGLEAFVELSDTGEKAMSLAVAFAGLRLLRAADSLKKRKWQSDIREELNQKDQTSENTPQ